MSGIDTIDKKALEKGFICVGALRGPHGVKGLVKIASFTEISDRLFDFKDLRLGLDFKEISLTYRSVVGDVFLCAADCIATREEAIRLKGERLFVSRQHLDHIHSPASSPVGRGNPEEPAANDLSETESDDFFHADLIGLEAYTPEHNRIGYVRSVEDFGAGDLLEIILEEPVKGLGKIVFIPFTHALVPVVNIKGNHLVINMDQWVSDQMIVRPDGSEPSNAAKSKPDAKAALDTSSHDSFKP